MEVPPGAGGSWQRRRNLKTGRWMDPLFAPSPAVCACVSGCNLADHVIASTATRKDECPATIADNFWRHRTATRKDECPAICVRSPQSQASRSGRPHCLFVALLNSRPKKSVTITSLFLYSAPKYFIAPTTKHNEAPKIKKAKK
jgi:hypothetical protein